MKKGTGIFSGRVRTENIPVPFFIMLLAAVAGCGRKGPPLPPLVRVPAAPADFRAERRGDTVEIGFTAPSTNTDKTRPANIERVDVYGYTGPGPITDAELIRQGDRVGSVEVRQPRDPDRTIDPGDPASDLEPLEGDGIEQGSATHLFEELTSEMLTARGATVDPDAGARPLPGFPCSAPARTYIGVGVSTSGRPGPVSSRARVPLVPAPPPPPQPVITYDETGVTLAWDPVSSGSSGGRDGEALLPARPLPCGEPSVGYHVYEVSADPFERRLTESAVAQPGFVDRRVDWGAERCYTVRAMHTIEGLAVESEPAPPACATLADTFPPAAPQGLVAVASEGAINLIWDANGEKDLSGYVVLRARADTRTFEPVTTEPIQDSTFTDTVEAGTPYIYAVQAVDTAGNRSAPSAETTPETAR